MVLPDKPNQDINRCIKNRDRVLQRATIPPATVAGRSVQQLIPQGIEMQEHWHSRLLPVVRFARQRDSLLAIANACFVPPLPAIDVEEGTVQKFIDMNRHRLTRSVRVTPPQLWISQPRTNKVAQRRIVAPETCSAASSRVGVGPLTAPRALPQRYPAAIEPEHPCERGPETSPDLEGSGRFWRSRLRKALPGFLVSTFSVDKSLGAEGGESTRQHRSEWTDLRQPRIGHSSISCSAGRAINRLERHDEFMATGDGLNVSHSQPIPRPLLLVDSSVFFDVPLVRWQS